MQLEYERAQQDAANLTGPLAYIEYLKREFVVPGATDDLAADGKWTGALLLDALGITDAAGREALDQEWRAWVMALCEQHQDEDWLPTRAGLFKTMGVK